MIVFALLSQGFFYCIYKKLLKKELEATEGEIIVEVLGKAMLREENLKFK